MGHNARNTDGDENGLSKDAVFDALSNEHRRMILEYLAEQPEKDFECEGVVEYLSDQETSGRDYETIDIVCHHSHFPKLEEAGLITHDVQARTIHLERSGMIKKLVEMLEEFEE